MKRDKETRWNKARDVAAGIGGVTVEIMKQVLANLMIEALKRPGM